MIDWPFITGCLDDRRRVAVLSVTLGIPDLDLLLELLPADTKILARRVNRRQDCLDLVVEHPSFPQEACEAHTPIVAAWYQSTLGRVSFQRWELTRYAFAGVPR